MSTEIVKEFHEHDEGTRTVATALVRALRWNLDAVPNDPQVDEAIREVRELARELYQSMKADGTPSETAAYEAQRFAAATIVQQIIDAAMGKGAKGVANAAAYAMDTLNRQLANVALELAQGRWNSGRLGLGAAREMVEQSRIEFERQAKEESS